MALVGIELVTHASEPDALTTQPQTHTAIFYILPVQLRVYTGL